MWKIGQKIVCIRDDHSGLGLAGLKRNRIYTFNGYAPKCCCGQQSIYIKEIHFYSSNLCKCGIIISDNCIFNQNRFKPIEYYGNAISEILDKFKHIEKEIDFDPVKELINFNS